MADLGWPELSIIIITFVLLFGWKKMPDMARSLGRSARIFKSEVDEMRTDGAASSTRSTSSPTASTTTPTTPLPTTPLPYAATAGSLAEAEARAAALEAEARAAAADVEVARLRAAMDLGRPTTTS
ncbi:MAG: Sec-independent protein translocase subunit TatA [Humibacillus sp.]